MSKISDMTRESWIMSTFPEWGTWLNEDIEREEVKPGTVAMWWLGCTGIWMKTPGGANISIDLWCGNGKRTHGDDKMKVGHQMANMCGARRMQPNLRAIPFVFDPFGFKQVDAVLATHYHQDHMSAEWAAHVINSGMTTVDENGKEILNLTEGNLATVSCLTPGAPTCHRMAECHTYNMWKGLDEMISDYFSKITLADLAAPEEAGNDYVI